MNSRNAIIDLGDGSAVLASRIVGVRRSSRSATPRRTLVDVMGTIGTQTMAVDSSSEAEGVENRARIIAEWKSAISGEVEG